MAETPEETRAAESNGKEVTAPSEAACPVCQKLMQLPVPELCPHCGAPIEPIMNLLRTADLSLREALRDLRMGDLESVSRRLNVVRVTSKAHRIRAQVIEALADRIRGDPLSALAKLRACREEMSELDDEFRQIVEQGLKQAEEDQRALAACCELYNFALFEAKRGHYEAARDALQRALEHVPHHAPSRALLGKVLYALGHDDEARSNLERALAVDPGNLSASRMLARMGVKPRNNLLAVLPEHIRFSSRWLGPIFVVLVLLFLALTALLSR